MATGDPLRDSPRIDRPEYDGSGNFELDPVEKAALRDRMEDLLLEILKYFAVLDEKGELEEDDSTYDV